MVPQSRIGIRPFWDYPGSIRRHAGLGVRIPPRSLCDDVLQWAMFEIGEKEEGIFFYVKVQTRASSASLEGIHGDSIKIKLREAPVDEAANKALKRFLAALLKVKRTDVEIRSGAHSKRKGVFVRGAVKKDLQRLLNLS